MTIIHAIFQGGVFLPAAPVDLPDLCEVEFEPRIVQPKDRSAALADVYAVLSRRFESGDSCASERGATTSREPEVALVRIAAPTPSAAQRLSASP